MTYIIIIHEIIKEFGGVGRKWKVSDTLIDTDCSRDVIIISIYLRGLFCLTPVNDMQ